MYAVAYMPRNTQLMLRVILVNLQLGYASSYTNIFLLICFIDYDSDVLFVCMLCVFNIAKHKENVQACTSAETPEQHNKMAIIYVNKMVEK